MKSGNNKIIYLDILTALADATNDLSMPCNEQRTGDATDLVDTFLHICKPTCNSVKSKSQNDLNKHNVDICIRYIVGYHQRTQSS